LDILIGNIIWKGKHLKTSCLWSSRLKMVHRRCSAGQSRQKWRRRYCKR